MSTTSSSAPGLFSKLRRDFSRAPMLFLILELPVVAADLVTRLVEPEWAMRPWLAFAVLLLFSQLPSFLSLGLTGATLRRLDRDRTPDLGALLERMGERLAVLAPAALLVMVLVLVGLLLLIIPGLYFGMIYLFVPMLILDSDSPLRLSPALAESKRLARMGFWPLALVLLPLIVTQLGISFGAEAGILYLVPSLTASPVVGRVCAWALESLLMVPIGALANVCLARIYLERKYSTASAATKIE